MYRYICGFDIFGFLMFSNRLLRGEMMSVDTYAYLGTLLLEYMKIGHPGRCCGLMWCKCLFVTFTFQMLQWHW